MLLPVPRRPRRDARLLHPRVREDEAPRNVGERDDRDPRGCLLKVAGWTLVASAFSAEPWAIGSIFGLFLLGATSTKDFSDVAGDRAGGCMTLPVKYGNRKAVAIISPFFVLPWLLLPVLARTSDPCGERAPAPDRQPGSPHGARPAPRRLGRLHGSSPEEESGRALHDREPPVVDSHVPHAHGAQVGFAAAYLL